jgi:uncharacterized membrane protein AbrB (regulator of aidB expression)
MEKNEEKQIKKLSIRTIVSFILFLAFWIMACLLGEKSTNYNTMLAICSLIPGGFYIVNAYKLLTALGMDELHTHL